MKKNTRQRQPLESLQPCIRKKQNCEILDADKHIDEYQKNIKNLITLFNRDNTDDDFTQNLLTASNISKLQKVQNLTLDDIKNTLFTFGPKIQHGDFSQGDRVSKITSLRRSTVNGKLIATVQWKQRPDGTIPNQKEYFTNEIAKHVPQKLIKFYKSKMTTKTITQEEQ